MAPRYRNASIVRAIIIATIIAGTLDILSAFVFAGLAGGTPMGVLRAVGGAIVDRKAFDPAVLAAIGLLLHFSIMLVMVTVYMLAAARVALLNRVPVLSGIAYGLVLWLVMYWIVLPRRWPAKFPTLDPREVGMELFSHIVLVGIPIALIARAASRWQPIARHH
jgi:uncharacterized membrane protein YagU involved in acid resistance